MSAPRVQLRRLVMLSLALLALSATPAAASSVTSPALTPSTRAGGASARWVFRFVPHHAFSFVTVRFPPGTRAAAGTAFLEPYLGGSAQASTAEAFEDTLRWHWNGMTFPAEQEVALVVPAVVNPPAGADGALITLNTDGDG